MALLAGKRHKLLAIKFSKKIINRYKPLLTAVGQLYHR